MDNNLTLFTNAISTMAGESESISIPTKSMASTYATVPTASAVRYGILLMGILPIVCWQPVLSSGPEGERDK